MNLSIAIPTYNRSYYLNNNLKQLLKEFENWNYASVKTMDLIMSNFTVDEMFENSRLHQLSICQEYSLLPADVFFLGQSGDKYYKRRRRMFDSPTARLCLTALW